MVYKTISISPTFVRLLKYVVDYKRLRGRASVKLIAEQLILAYAKQITTGMPEAVWRANMLALINECDKEHQEYYDHERAKHEELKRKASQTDSNPTPLLRRIAKRKTFRGISKETATAKK